MDKELRRRGKEPAQTWRPHVSLAYMTDRELAAEAKMRLTEWDKLMRLDAGDKVIMFTSFDLCCFLDMTKFLFVR
jgi:hypothetical protein